MKHLKCYLFVWLFIFANALLAQSDTKYNIDFVTASRIKADSFNNLYVIYLLTPKEKEDFPPVLSMKLTYFTDEIKKPNVVNLMKQTGKGNISMTLYGENVKDKSKMIYELIADKINLTNYKDLLLVVFQFKDKIDLNTDKMSIIYGFWEKNNQDIRVEKQYNFKIEKIALKDE